MSDIYTSEDDKLISEALKDDSLFKIILKNEYTIICSHCKDGITVTRDTFLPNDCPSCGKPYNYAKAAYGQMQIITDLMMAILHFNYSKNEDEKEGDGDG